MISGVFVFKIKGKDKFLNDAKKKILSEPYAIYIENPIHMLLAISLSFAQ
jgi:hypothetical protein